MRIAALITGTVSLALDVLLGTAWAAESATPGPIAVEIWRHGDIGSTVKFAEAVEQEIYGSTMFKRNRTRQPETLVIFISATVQQVEIENRSQSWYQVEFKTVDEKNLGTSSGACWADGLSRCAKRVRADAELAALRMSAVALPNAQR